MRRRLLRRGAVVALFAAALAPAAPSAAVDERPRNELLLRIASLTDETQIAQARVVGAQLRGERARSEVARVRVRAAERAVAAYLRGSSATPAPDAYTDVVAARQAELMDRLRRARAIAADAAAEVEDLAAASAGPTSELAALHAQLDALDAELAAQRSAEQRAADEARRAALEAAMATPTLTPRHRRAMAKQSEIMARYPFGPLEPGTVPAGLRAEGEATVHLSSWYGPGFNGRATASGAIYDQEGWTVASPTLPLGTLLVVSRGDRSALLLVNDRGPYIPPRTLDLSHAAAVHLGVGVDEVTAQIVVPA